MLNKLKFSEVSLNSFSKTGQDSSNRQRFAVSIFSDGFDIMYDLIFALILLACLSVRVRHLFTVIVYAKASKDKVDLQPLF